MTGRMLASTDMLTSTVIVTPMARLTAAVASRLCRGWLSASGRSTAAIVASVMIQLKKDLGLGVVNRSTWARPVAMTPPPAAAAA